MSKNQSQNKGSILIWTVLLGFLLTSVFFFYSMRQRSNIAVQRDTAEILNTKTYVKSYAEYLKSLSPSDAQERAEINNIKANGINFDGITGSFTNKTGEIIGIADFKASVTYSFSGDIYIEWNKCPETTDLNFPKGDLVVNDTLYDHDNNDECVDDDKEEYDDIIGPITVSSPKIETLNNPFEFRITPKDSESELIDNKWHIELEVDMGYGNKVELSEDISQDT